MPGNARHDQRLDDRADFRRLRAAVGVAENDPARAGVIGRLCTGDGIGGVCLVAVEEMFAVDHCLLTGGNGGLDALGDAFEIFLVGAAERDLHMAGFMAR